MKPILVFDFVGTLVRMEMIDKANAFRAEVLERTLPSVREHTENKILYKNNREFVKKLTGITKRHKVLYRSNTGEEIMLKGEQVQNQIATNLFQIGMFMVAKKYGKRIFLPDFLNVIKKLKKRFDLAIVSGVRTDIISGMLEIAGLSGLFMYIKGQPPMLGRSNEELLKELPSTIVALVGDKKDDLMPAKELMVKAIFVTWGTPQGGEEKIADAVVREPKELLEVI